MPTQTNALADLRRPKMLVRAARHGMTDYSRSRSLRRLLPGHAAPSSSEALALLLEREAALDRARRDGSVGYSVSRHIELLVALMAEARLSPQDAPRPN